MDELETPWILERPGSDASMEFCTAFRNRDRPIGIHRLNDPDMAVPGTGTFVPAGKDYNIAYLGVIVY